MNTTPHQSARPGLRRLAVLLLCASLLAGCGQRAGTRSGGADTLDRIQRDKVIRAAYINYPPTAFKDPKTGEMTGHFVDALRELARTLDPQIKVEFVEPNWADFATVLNSGRADVSICGTFTTIPRAKLVTFTRPLVYLGRGAIVRKDDARWKPGEPVEQFDRPDLRIGVVNGEGSHEFVKANFRHQDHVVVFDGDDLSQCLAAVSAGQVDVGLSDSLETSKYAAHPEVVDVYAQNPQNIMPIAWSVRHDDLVWKNFLDTAISTFEAQGKLRAWEAKYGFKWTKPVLDLRPRD